MQAAITPFAALFVLLFSGAQCQMLISSNAPVVHVGGEFIVDCQVTGLPPGETVTWYKRQTSGSVTSEDVFGYGKNIVASWEKMNRYSVTVESEGAVVDFILTVKDAMREDSGEYACGYIGAVIAEWQTISVVSQVTELKLSTYQTPDMNDIRELGDGDELDIQEGQQGRFLCEATGSNPAPELTMSLEEHDLTAEFEYSQELTVEESTSEFVPADATAMKLISYKASLKSKNPLQVGHEQGELLARKRLICSAKIMGHEPVETTAQLVFKVKPKVNCTDMEVAEGKNAELVCVIRADPQAHTVAFRWQSLLDKSNETISPGEIRGALNFHHLKDGDHAGEQIATLQISRAAANNFNTYYLDATNTMGTGWDTAELIKDAAASVSGASQLAVLPAMLLVCVAAAIFKKI